MDEEVRSYDPCTFTVLKKHEQCEFRVVSFLTHTCCHPAEAHAMPLQTHRQQGFGQTRRRNTGTGARRFDAVFTS